MPVPTLSCWKKLRRGYGASCELTGDSWALRMSRILSRTCCCRCMLCGVPTIHSGRSCLGSLRSRNRLADGARRYTRRESQEVHLGDWSVTFARNDANSTKETYGDLDALRHAIQALP